MPSQFISKNKIYKNKNKLVVKGYLGRVPAKFIQLNKESNFQISFIISFKID